MYGVIWIYCVLLFFDAIFGTPSKSSAKVYELWKMLLREKRLLVTRISLHFLTYNLTSTGPSCAMSLLHTIFLPYSLTQKTLYLQLFLLLVHLFSPHPPDTPSTTDTTLSSGKSAYIWMRHSKRSSATAVIFSA